MSNEIKRGAFLKVIGTALLGGVATACAAKAPGLKSTSTLPPFNPNSYPTPTGLASTPVEIQRTKIVPIPLSTTPRGEIASIPTVLITQKETAVPVPDIVNYNKDGLTEVQIAAFDRAYSNLNDWWNKVWSQDGSIQNANWGLSSEIMWDGDDPGNQDKAMLVVKTGRISDNNVYYLPIVDGKYIDKAPILAVGYNPDDFEPTVLERTISVEEAKDKEYPPGYAGTVLKVKGGNPVRIDPETGKTVATWSMDKKEWEPVEVVMGRVEMDINGNTVPFEIVREENGIEKTWEKIGVKSLGINPNLKNPEEKFSLLMESLFWILSDAGYGNVSFEDYMKYPDKYSIRSIPGTPEFRLSDVHTVQLRYLDYNDRRMGEPDGNKAKAAYELTKDGKFVIYRTMLWVEGGYDWLTTGQYDNFRDSGLEQAAGNDLGAFPLRMLSLISTISPELKKQVLEYSGYPQGGDKYTIKGWLNKLYSECFWYAELEDK